MREADAELRVLGADPLTWVSYGLISSQLCDVQDEFITQEDGSSVTVSQFLFNYYNYRSPTHAHGPLWHGFAGSSAESGQSLG